MSILEESEASLYVEDSVRFFGGVNAPKDRTPYTIVGVPFDSTVTFRPGARFGPSKVREAASNIEMYSFRSNIDFEKVMFHDLGDLAVVHGDVKTTLYRLSKVVENLSNNGRIPVIIGGEHTVTYGCIRGLQNLDVTVIVLDAHFDLREDYMGLRFSHASTVRRLIELIGAGNVILIGVRAGCRDEVEYAKKGGLTFIPAHAIGSELEISDIARIVRRKVEGRKVYISVDLDVLDPAYAPGVGNPEPEGLSPRELLDILYELTTPNLVGFDVVELTPPYDLNGITSVLAAKVIVEIAASHYVKSRFGRSR